MTDQSHPVPVRIWDPWVRLTHWAIVVLLVASVASGLARNFTLHFWTGYALLALVLFRLAWGVAGSETARFASFLRGPGAAIRHLAEFRAPGPDLTPGHSASGGWAVVLLLGLLLAQATTGLMASDAIFTFGPLARLVDPDVSDLATSLHIRLWIALLAVVALHVIAVMLVQAWKRTDLVAAMLNGDKPLRPGTRPPAMGSPALALVLLAAASGAVWAISRLG